MVLLRNFKQACIYSYDLQQKPTTYKEGPMIELGPLAQYVLAVPRRLPGLPLC